MNHASRFVFAGSASWPLERLIEWAVARGFTRVDFNADAPANYPATFTRERVALIRDLATSRGVTIGLHTPSAVNLAEMTALAFQRSFG